ncbi:MAG: hypothetical protein ACOC3I_04460 [Verrucomicrobiota bacterium]
MLLPGLGADIIVQHPVQVGPQAYRIDWETTPGVVYRLERSLDLAEWTIVVTLTAEASSESFTDFLAPTERLVFWRVAELGPEGEPLEVSEILASAELSPATSRALFEITATGTEVIESVVFFDQGVPLGDARPGVGDRWTFSVALDSENPAVRAIEAEVSTEEGTVRRTAETRLLLADPNHFVPLDEAGVPVYGAFVPVGEDGALGPFRYFPEGFGAGDSGTGVFFEFAAGARLEEGGAGPRLRFAAGRFVRGAHDPAPVATNGAEVTLDLGDLDPPAVAAAFGLPGGGVPLPWGDGIVLWEDGVLGEGGWGGLQLDPGLGDFALPDGRLAVTVETDPRTGERALVVCFHGDWSPLPDTAFRLPRADPLKIYLFESGEVQAHGTAEATFPNGARLRGTLRWVEPVFEFSFEGKELTIPAIDGLAGRLPGMDFAGALPAGRDEASLDAARDVLLAHQRTLRAVAAGSSAQAGDDLSASGGAAAEIIDPGSSALHGWAHFLSAGGGGALSPELREIVAGVIAQAGKTAEASQDPAFVLRVLLDLRRLLATDETDFHPAAEAAATRALAAFNRLLGAAAGLEQGGTLDRLMQDVLGALGTPAGETSAVGEDLAGFVVRSATESLTPSGPEARPALARAYVEQRWPPAYFSERGIHPGDFSGEDNPALMRFVAGLPTSELVRGYGGTRAIITEMAALAAILAESGLDDSAYPMAEAVDQAFDALVEFHDARVALAGTLEEYLEVLDQRDELLALHRQLFAGQPEPFTLSTVTLVDRFQPVFVEAVAALPPERRIAVYGETLQALLGFAAAIESPALDGRLRENWAALEVLNGYFGLALADPAFCNLLATELTLAGYDLAPGDPAAGFDLSGSYEADDVAVATGGVPNRGLDTLQVNQAGLFIAGTLVQRSYFAPTVDGTPTVRDVRVRKLRFDGLLVAEAAGLREFAVRFTEEDGSAAGTGAFTFAAAGEEVILTANLELRGGSAEQRIFARFDTFAPLPEEVFESFDRRTREYAEGLHLHPVHQLEFDDMEATAEALKARIRAYFSTGDEGARTALAEEIDGLSEAALRRMPEFAKVHFRGLVRRRLHEQTFTSPLDGIERDYWDWLFRIANDEHDNGLALPGAAELADLPFVVSPRFRYDFDLLDLAASGNSERAVQVALEGGFLGMRVTKREVDGPVLDTFYLASLFAKFGSGVSLSIKGPEDMPVLPISGSYSGGSFVSSQSYQAADFKGALVIGDLTFKKSTINTVAYSPWASIYFVSIDEFADTSGLALGLNLDMTPSIGGSINVGTGYVVAAWDADKPAPTEAEEVSEPPSPITFSSTRDARTDGFLHFEEGQASINECGLQYLREFVADYRFIFEDPEALIEITGYTDPEGAATPGEGPEDNLTLSQNRAEAVHQALRQILAIDPADDFIPPANIVGLGEAPARAAGVPDGAEAPEWRKVEIVLEGRITLTLNGAARLP